jgi:hypothetical protein
LAYGINIGFGIRYKYRFWYILVWEINISFVILYESRFSYTE